MALFKIFWEEGIMFDKFKELLINELQVKESAITMDAELASDLGVNSIELADLVMICEEQFGLTIEDDDLHGFITVGDVVNYLEANCN
jgi:acyl carrier protein